MVKNGGGQDVMIQSWLEAGTPQEKGDIPFVITPSLSRLGGGKQQVLRILYYGEGLPTDRESVFWLNVQEIPQKAKVDNTLQIAVRQRIKMFYRPSGLKQGAEDVQKNLKWRVLGQGAQARLEVVNDSAYYVSFGKITLRSGSNTYEVVPEMLAPYKTSVFKINALDGKFSAAATQVEFKTINDYGGVISQKSGLSK
ncbi:chaperone CupC [Pseudomonas sp. R5-89-07]|nr:chaperone CupC [Pseudomonas sp. R5-89-07]